MKSKSLWYHNPAFEDRVGCGEGIPGNWVCYVFSKDGKPCLALGSTKEMAEENAQLICDAVNNYN